MTFRPYLFFGGRCRDAFTRYQEIFGGELTILTAADVPADAGEAPAGPPDLVLHAAVTLADGDYLMGSDEPTADGFGPVQGMMVAYEPADVAEANRVFDALAEGGTVTQALEPTFFSEAFGMCVDRFGTPWMVVAPEPSQSP